jgi:hypothetical protein
MAGNYHKLDMVVSPDGNSIYYGLGWNLYRYDIPGDTTVPMGTLPEQMVSMEFGPGGVLYGIGESRQLCTIDLDTLDVTHVGPSYLGLGTDGPVASLEFAPDGTLYTGVDPTKYVPGDPPDVYVSTIDPATGLGAIDWDARIHMGSSYYYMDTLAIPIPEPSSLVLLSIGAVALLSYVCRRRHWR